MMNKIFLIIKREFIVRVKKKSFIIMTLLAPILMASLIIVPVLLSDTDQQKRLIGVYENNINNLSSDLKDSENIHFTALDETEMDLFMIDPEQSNYYALLIIDSSKFTLYCSQQVGLNLRNSIKNQLEQIAERNKLKRAGINIEIIEQAKTSINIDTKIISSEGNTTSSSTEASIGIGFMTGILIYMFIFMYGTMVMRGVIEEKTNRIVEIIISSVKLELRSSLANFI